MSDTPRYAIYCAPGPDTDLWAFGSRVLGYDAVTGAYVHGFAPQGMHEDAWRRITSRPRTYGFHATLKAPFRLNGQTEADLRDALDAFAGTRSPVDVGRLLIAVLPTGSNGAGFVALTPAAPPAALARLEREIVSGFDRFRRPMTAEERELRRPQELSERQRAYLDAYGYPHVLDDFRFHMTLSGEVAEPASVASALGAMAGKALGAVRLVIDDLCLFRQESGTPFRLISRHRLTG